MASEKDTGAALGAGLKEMVDRLFGWGRRPDLHQAIDDHFPPPQAPAEASEAAAPASASTASGSASSEPPTA